MEQILDEGLSSPTPRANLCPSGTPEALLKTACPSKKHSLTYSGPSFMEEEAGEQSQKEACLMLPNDLENIHLLLIVISILQWPSHIYLCRRGYPGSMQTPVWDLKIEISF